jgi:hypothetical protein
MTSNFKKLEYKKFSNLLLEIEKLLTSNKISWKHNQICLNTISTKSNDYHLGTGSLIKDWENSKTIKTNIGNILIVGKKNNILEEKNFDTLCDVFRGTVIEEIYNFVGSKCNHGRIRLMRMEPKTCLSWHKDSEFRLHYVLKTSFGNKMIIDDECLHLEENCWYMTNTTKFHSAFNGSAQSRIHLVCSIL